MVETFGSTALEVLGGYLVARCTIRTPGAFAGFCTAFAGAILLSLLPALYEQATGREIVLDIVRALPGVGTFSPAPYGDRLGLSRVRVAFAHPILYGLIACCALPLVFVALRRTVPLLWRGLLSGLITLTVLLSLSSGPILAAALQLVLIVWGRVFRWLREPWLLFALMLLALYVTVDLASSRTPLRVFLSHATFSSETAYLRLHIFDWGLVNIRANPVFGLGLRDWTRPEWMSGSVDNFWLLTTMRYGLPGGALMAGGYLALLWQVARHDLADDERLADQRRAWVITMTALAFALCTVHVWSTAFSFLAFMIGSGVWFLDRPPPDQAGTARSTAIRYTRIPHRFQTMRTHP